MVLTQIIPIINAHGLSFAWKCFNSNIIKIAYAQRPIYAVLIVWFFFSVRVQLSFLNSNVDYGEGWFELACMGFNTVPPIQPHYLDKNVSSSNYSLDFCCSGTQFTNRLHNLIIAHKRPFLKTPHIRTQSPTPTEDRDDRVEIRPKNKSRCSSFATNLLQTEVLLHHMHATAVFLRYKTIRCYTVDSDVRHTALHVDIHRRTWFEVRLLNRPKKHICYLSSVSRVIRVYRQFPITRKNKFLASRRAATHINSQASVNNKLGYIKRTSFCLRPVKIKVTSE